MTEQAPISDGLIWRSVLPASNGNSEGFTTGLNAPLTHRQLSIAELVARGLSTDEISSILKISSETIKHHKANLYKKMGVESELEMTLKAINIGLLDTADLVPADFDPSVFDNLTPRQRDVTKLIALRGYTNKDIARELNLSEYTVKDLVSLVFERTNTTQRVNLAVGYLEARRRMEADRAQGDVPTEVQIFPAVASAPEFDGVTTE